MSAGPAVWSPAPDPERSPAVAVLGQARETMPAMYAQCPVCEDVLQPVPFHLGEWRACRRCHPATFEQ